MPNTVRVRDPIHSFIELGKDEWRAVDSRVFQRLRRIKQLAMTHLVYPGTTHTRFEHSIGARHVATRLCTTLSFDGDEARPVLCAALLHDVGHGPFSHVSEQVLDQLSGVEDVHEAISVALIRTDPELREALGEESCDAAASLIAGGTQSVYRDIVSSSVDADKLDYLLRDTYFAGVNYGRYDLDRVIESAVLVGTKETQTFLGFDIGGLWAVEELLLARHHMWRQVYGHKTRIATDIMITRAILAGIEEGVLPLDAFAVPTVDGKPAPGEKFLSAFLEQTDSTVLETLRRDAPNGSVARDLVDRLLDRRLLRQTKTIPLHKEPERLDGIQLAKLLDPQQFTQEDVRRAETELAKELRLPAHLVAVYFDRWSNPTYRLPGVGGRQKIHLVRDGRPVFLHKESEIFRAEVGEEQTHLHLYTPELTNEDCQRAEEAVWRILESI